MRDEMVHYAAVAIVVIGLLLVFSAYSGDVAEFLRSELMAAASQ